VVDPRNLLALGVSYAVIAIVLVAGIRASRTRRISRATMREATHIGAGMWAVPTLKLFTSWEWGIVPALTFIPLNWWLDRREYFGAERHQPKTLGTVLFPVSFAGLLALFWRPGVPGDLGYVAVAGIMALAWGDSLASIVGMRFGRHRYRVWSNVRTVEGSVAMLCGAIGSVVPVLHFLGGLAWDRSIAIGSIVALVATLVEALSPGGSDNLTVPVAAALTARALV
jgi:phytol kinase